MVCERPGGVDREMMGANERGRAGVFVDVDGEGDRGLNGSD